MSRGGRAPHLPPTENTAAAQGAPGIEKRPHASWDRPNGATFWATPKKKKRKYTTDPPNFVDIKDERKGPGAAAAAPEDLVIIYIVIV